MSNDTKSRQRRFKIIKILYSEKINGKNVFQDFLAHQLRIQEHEVSKELRSLETAGFVIRQRVLSKFSASITSKAFNPMDKEPRPINYDEFLDRVVNPQRPYGKAVKIVGPKESFWTKHKTGIIIGIISAVLGGIGIFLTIGYNEGWFQ